MLLYLVKHSRPDIANPVRELSKVLDGATEEAFKEMLRVIKYVLDTKSWGLKIQPTFGEEAWDLVCFCDSDYAGDPDSRKVCQGTFYMYVECQFVGDPRLKGQLHCLAQKQSGLHLVKLPRKSCSSYNCLKA